MLGRRLALAALAVIVLSFGGAFAQPGAATGAVAPTVVSIEFDDGTADQYQVRSILSSRGSNATFYVNSSQVGVPGYMTQRQLSDLAADGNEIGGHTQTHVHLPTLSLEQQQRQICNDRVRLLNMGFQIRNFAYPYGEANAQAQSVVERCGYNSGRLAAGLGGAGPYAETVPPADPYALRTAENVTNTTTLADLQGYVTQAEQTGGGWVQLVFHRECTSDCGVYGSDPALLADLLDWLTARGTPVRTVAQVIGGAVQPAVPGPDSPTTVSLTFDDGTDDQYQARSILASHGMKGVFYVNSGRLGLPGYMTQQQLSELAADGNEIGGHTVSHADLPTLPADEQRRQVCNDRASLLNLGFQVHDFAYPYGNKTSETEQVAEGCGYNSARALGGIVSPNTCFGCDYAETVPPRAIYATRTPDSVRTTTTLADLKTHVTQSEANGGGWLTLAFHHLCSGSGCNTLSVSPTTLDSFLDWLQERGTTVKTVHEVIGGELQPAVAGPAPAFNDGVLQNGSLEATGATGTFPDCWRLGGSGTTTATGQRTADAHTGSYGYRIDVSSIAAGSDKKLYSTQDLGACAPGVKPGDVYRLSAWYKANAASRFVAYYRTAAGGWVWWAQQPANLPPATDWRLGSWQMPPIPSGATAISVALSVRSVGTLTMDDFSLQTGDTAPPSATISSPAEGAMVTGNVTLSANVSDNVGVTKVDFFVAGQLVGSVTDAPWQFVWDSATATQSDLGITARAWDAAGNSAYSPGVNVTVAPPPPPLPGSGLLENPSLEQASGGSVPDCWQRGSSGSNTAVWTRSADAHSGSFSERVQITSLSSGDRKLVVKQDSGTCAPSVESGATYRLSGWYKATVPARFVVFTRNATTGKWSYWTQSPPFAAGASWTKATWTTPAVPAGVSSLSFGLNVAAVGALTVDDLDFAPTS